VTDEKAARPVYPSFGLMGYWRLIEERDPTLPRNPVERADWLYGRLQLTWDKPAKGAISPQLLKAMALELSAYFGGRGGESTRGRPQMPDSLLRALAMMLELPQTFLDDPVPVLAGKLAQGKHAGPKARAAAMEIDTAHFIRHGERLAENALAKRLQEVLGLRKPIARSTLHKWRDEPEYWSFAEFVRAELAKKTFISAK
jgi:hypothetical protein